MTIKPQKPLNADGEVISFNMRWLTILITIVVSITGWIINRTLNSINDNITELRMKLEANAVIQNDHEGRLRVLEAKEKMLEQLKEKNK